MQKKEMLPQSSGCNHFENMTENFHVCFEENKLEKITINKSKSFCLIYFRHRRKKFCYLGAYSNTKSSH